MNAFCHPTRQGEHWHKEWPLDNDPDYAREELNIVGVVPGAGPQGEDVVAQTTRAVALPGTPEAFTHDADGNLTADGQWTYAWDAENRLLAMTGSAGVPPAARLKLVFAYDAGWRRVSKKVYAWDEQAQDYAATPTTDLRFLYDAWNLQCEIDGGNAPVRSYIWGLDLSGTLQGAGGIGGLLFTTFHPATQPPTPHTHSVHFDGNGNVSALVSMGDVEAYPAGMVTAAYLYSPFGRELLTAEVSTTDMPLRFSTKYLDAASELYSYGYRYYGPVSTGWLNRDLAGEWIGIALNTFLLNNPLDQVDPHGLDPSIPVPTIPADYELVGKYNVYGKPNPETVPFPAGPDEIWRPGFIDGKVSTWFLYKKKQVPFQWYTVDEQKTTNIRQCTALVIVGHNTWVEKLNRTRFKPCTRVGALGCWSGDNVKIPAGHEIPNFPKPSGAGSVGMIGDGPYGNAGYKSWSEMIGAALKAAKDVGEAMSTSDECKSCCKEIIVYAACQPALTTDNGFTRWLNDTQKTWCNRQIASFPVK